MNKGIRTATDPNLDVAEFLHIYFDVAASEVMEGVVEEADDEGYDNVELEHPTRMV